MNFLKAFNALNYIVHTPKTRQALEAQDPHALKLADEALALSRYPNSRDTDRVAIKTRIIVERLENIAANFCIRPAVHIQAEMCNGHGFISCKMRHLEEAKCFAAFVRMFVNQHVTVEEHANMCCVEIRIDEDNA